MKIGIVGAGGRMGLEVENACQIYNLKYIKFVKGLSLNDFCQEIDVIIDFSQANFAMQVFEIAAKNGCKIVSGTTGFSSEQKQKLLQIAEKTAFFYASNMSIGIAILEQALEIANKNLQDFEVEIFERHHHLKKDAPSGTALTLGEKLSGKPVNYLSSRISDVKGEHVVRFENESEILQFSHIAKNRSIFAKGAVEAAKWIYKMPNGLYGMHNLIN